MENRLNMLEVEPDGYKTLFPIEKFLHASDLSPVHSNLIKIRASQVNGCAYCINLHTAEARNMGESEKRIFLLSAWRDTTFFTKEERAILALTEEVTLINNHVSDETYQQAAALFDKHYLAKIILCIVSINSWNRVAITTGQLPA